MISSEVRRRGLNNNIMAADALAQIDDHAVTFAGGSGYGGGVQLGHRNQAGAGGEPGQLAEKLSFTDVHNEYLGKG